MSTGETLGTDNGPKHRCGGTVYGYKLVRYPAEEGRGEEWYADWRCIGCGAGGAFYVGNAAPAAIRDVVVAHYRAVDGGVTHEA